MVVRNAPRTVQMLLRFVARGLPKPQAQNLKLMVVGLLICGSGKLRTLAETTRDPMRHRTSLSRFLRSSAWPEAATLERTARRVLQAMRPRRGEVLSLLIDGTTIEKFGQHMDAVKKSFDHSRKRFCEGHTVLLMAVRFRGVVLPWRIQLWLPRDFCDAESLEFQKLTVLAAQAIKQFEPPAGLKVRVLFDAGLLCPPVVRACESRGFSWFSVAARNRKLKCRRRPERSIGDIGPGALKHNARRIRLRRTGSRWRWMHIAAIDGFLKRIGPVRIVFCKRINDPSGHQLAIVTSDLRRDPRDIVANYETRWWIEVLFRELKGQLGLGQYQMQTWTGITRYLHVVCLAHLTLTHHALKAVGAQAKERNQELTLPGISTRLATLRDDMRRQTIMRFLARFPASRLKARIRDFLLSP